ncbi:hypothetical protein BH09BAC5_BH09BAC5_16400 [soil metagenome]
MENYSFFIPGKYYLIYNHGNGAETIFKKRENYFYFLKRQEQQMSKHWQLIAWSLLPDCYYLIVKINKSFPDGMHWHEINKTISFQFGHFTNGYAKAINKAYTRRGSLFAKKFRRTLLRDSYLLKQEILRIHFIPVERGYVSSPYEWKFSSCRKIHQYQEANQFKEMIKPFDSKNNFIAAHLNYKSNNIAA